MRNRLIELLKSPHKAEQLRQMGVPIGKYEDDCVEAMIADFLLANSVLVPPCKVGDTVFIIDNRDMIDIDTSVCSVVEDEIYEMCYGRTQSGELKWLFLVVESGEDFYDDEVNKIVFLTRDEAEKTLSKMNGGAE